MTTSIEIDARFCGPPSSANGGYTAGALAAFIDGPAEVTLRAPPPLGVALALETQADGVALKHGALLVAQARPTELDFEVPAPVDFAEATRASADFLGFRQHTYPSCFVCGPKRAPGDGLRLFPGAVSGRSLVAAPWQPSAELCDEQGLVRERFVWAALDCPSWFGYSAFTEHTQPFLLGRLSARVLSSPKLGEPCVVQGWALSREGRRIMCASALYGSDGALHAFARATWIELKA